MIIHGHAISAEEVERIVSREFQARRFASLCNAIVWGIAGRRCSSIPAFTERVNVADGGIDGEWSTELPEDHTFRSSLLSPGWNVFQYKQRDITTQNRNRILSNIKSSLKGALRDIAEHHPMPHLPEQYVFFTNIDMTGNEKQVLEQSIRGRLPRRRSTASTPTPRRRTSSSSRSVSDQAVNAVHVVIVGAGELASFLNDLPHLRSAYFAWNRFSIWETAWEAHRAAKTYGANVGLIGRDVELREVRALVDDPNVRVVTLMGPPSIGKSRLLLEATRHRSLETIVAVDPLSLTADDLLALAAPGQEVVVILEDPDPHRVDRLVAQALAQPGLKLALTLPVVGSAPSPDLGADPRIRGVPLLPLDDGQARFLLVEAQIAIDYGLASWIVTQAGGNPGILLLAAASGASLRDQAGAFTTRIARDRARKVRDQCGDTAVDSLRLLSLLTYVGVDGEDRVELEHLCVTFADGPTLNKVLQALASLQDAGVLRKVGPYVEVVPPLLANHLASEAVLGQLSRLQSLFESLDPAPRRRMVRRLQGIPGDDVRRFWAWLSAGSLRDFATAAASGDTLRLLADADPGEVLRVVRDGVDALTPDERRNLGDRVQANLRGALERLLFHADTVAEALKILALLAEVETVSYSNNAHGLVCECFHPLHPQLPLPFSDRLRVLEGFLLPNQPECVRLLGIHAIASAFDRFPQFALRPSDGYAPLDAGALAAPVDRRAYRSSLLDLLMAQAQCPEPVIAMAAARALPAALRNGGMYGLVDVALRHFDVVVNWALDHDNRILVNIADLSDALSSVEAALNRSIGAVDGETDAKIQDYIHQTRALMDRLEQGNFPTRLRRWTGNDLLAQRFGRGDTAGQRVDRADDALHGLAREIVRAPDLLGEDAVAWLLSDQAVQAHLLFWWLGREDTGGHLMATIVELGKDARAARLFGAYWGQYGRHDGVDARARLDELTADGEVTGQAIILATSEFIGDVAAVARIGTLIAQGRVSRSFVGVALRRGGWTTGLNQRLFLRVLTAVNGSDFSNVSDVLELLNIWIAEKRPVTGALAAYIWQCLKHSAELQPTGLAFYSYDRVAAVMTRSDPERGVELLDWTVRQPSFRARSYPLGHGYGDEWWQVLREVSGRRALETVLVAALDDPSGDDAIAWRLRERVDQEDDEDVLIAWGLMDERHASIVAAAISAGRPGFWPIATMLIQAYPHSQRLRVRLTAGAEWFGEDLYSMSSGGESAYAEQCLVDINHLLDVQASGAVRDWLIERRSSLEAEILRRRNTALRFEVNNP